MMDVNLIAEVYWNEKKIVRVLIGDESGCRVDERSGGW